MLPAMAPAGGVKILKLHVWDNPALFDKPIAIFMKTHPGVTVFVEEGQGIKKLIQDLDTGAEPDVAAVEACDFEALVSTGRMVGLDSFVSSDRLVNPQDYYPIILERFRSAGKLYALPRDISPDACVYYNKTAFDRARIPYPKSGWTWEDLRQTARKFVVRNTAGETTSFGYADAPFMNVETWVYSSGGQIVDDEKTPRKLVLDSAKAIRGIQFWWKMAFVDRAVPTREDRARLRMNNRAMFAAGKVAMYHSGFFESAYLRETIGKAFDWDAATFPAGPDGLLRFEAGGSGYCILQGTANPGLAWELVRSLAGPDGQRHMMEAGRLQPCLKPLAESPAFLEDGKKPRNRRIFLDGIGHMVMPPRWKLGADFWTGEWEPTTGYLFGPEYRGGEEGVANAVNAIVARANRWYFGPTAGAGSPGQKQYVCPLGNYHGKAETAAMRVLTSTLETDRFLIRYEPAEPIDKLIPCFAREYGEILGKLETKLKMKYRGKIEVFVYRDAKELQFITGSSSDGYSTGNITHIPVGILPQHELTHILAGQWNSDENRKVPADPDGGSVKKSEYLFLVEGLADAMTRMGRVGVPISDWMWFYDKVGAIPPLFVVRADFPRIEEGGMSSYWVAGSFIEMLMEHYGLVRVKRFYFRPEAEKEILGKNIKDLDIEWREWLAKRPVDLDKLLRAAGASAVFEKRIRGVSGSVTVKMAPDDMVLIYQNGKLMGGATNWMQPSRVALKLNGNDILRFVGVNFAGVGGLLFEITRDDTGALVDASNASWLATDPDGRLRQTGELGRPLSGVWDQSAKDKLRSELQSMSGKWIWTIE
jgi:multiple sugar transport system substrate-binding protein